MWRAVVALCVVLLAGCIDATEFVPAKPPLLENPVANLPREMHIRNWPSKTREKYGQGSCVHASLIHALKWQGDEELASRWRGKYSGGETSVSITRYLKAEGIPYVSTLNERTYECSGDPEFLQWVSDTRRAAVIWWKPSHACTFMGFVERGGVKYAVVLDNNIPGKFEYHEINTFIREWRRFGGFALAVIGDEYAPTAPLPWNVVVPIDKDESFWNRRLF